MGTRNAPAGGRGSAVHGSGRSVVAASLFSRTLPSAKRLPILFGLFSELLLRDAGRAGRREALAEAQPGSSRLVFEAPEFGVLVDDGLQLRGAVLGHGVIVAQRQWPDLCRIFHIAIEAWPLFFGHALHAMDMWHSVESSATKEAPMDITRITPGDAVEVDGDRWNVDSVHPATRNRGAYLACTRIASAGPDHAHAEARDVAPHQITEHLLAGELTRF